MTPAEQPNRPPNDEPLPPVPESRGQHREAWVGAFVIIGIDCPTYGTFPSLSGWLSIPKAPRRVAPPRPG